MDAILKGYKLVLIRLHFDHVYGSTGSPSSAIFEECVAPLVDGLFHGHNTAVLAYEQTGYGKSQDIYHGHWLW